MAAPKKSAPNPVADAAASVAAATAATNAAPAGSNVVNGFVIEDGIPFPERRTAFAPRPSRYPFEALNPGQSFLVRPTEKNAEPWKTLSSTASRMNREHWPKVFGTARVMVDGQECVRVWRKADTTEPLAEPRKREPKPAASAPPPPPAGNFPPPPPAA